MLKKNEIIILSVSAVFMALMIGFQETGLNLNLLINGLIFSIIILTVWMSAKKYTAYYLDIEIEQKVWDFDRYWISTGSHFKKPIPRLNRIMIQLYTGWITNRIPYNV